MRCTPRIVLLAALCVFGATGRAADSQRPAYLDPSQPLEARVHDLVARMTLDEKAAEMMNTTPGVPRLGVPKYDWWNEALHGVARAGDATVFPQAIGLAAMWDDSLMREVAGVIGVEARAKYNGAGEHAGDRYYCLTFWSPNINIFRDPRWGRGQETYGEDPFLTSRMGVAFVRGLQGDDPNYLQAAACAKHYAVHSGPEPLRHIMDVRPPEADLYETYLPAFEALVSEAHVEGVMTAYNSLYGKPCSINPLLYGLLDRWGFNGYITSDCGSIADLSRSYKLAKDDAEAEALSISAGLMVRCGDNPPALADAVHRGLISEAVVDRQLGKLLRTLFRLGIFDPAEKVPYSKIAPSANNTPEHGVVAQRAADEAMVLLKNDGILPLDAAKLHRVAVIGPNASSDEVLVGNYNGHPTAPVTALAGIKAALGPNVVVDYVRGCDYGAQPKGLRPIPRSALRSEGYTGLMGDYFDNRELQGKPVARRRDRPVDIDFDRDYLWKNIPTQNASVRWTGTLVTTIGGDYTLGVEGRGRFRLILDGQTVIDEWTPGERTKTITRHLPENGRIPITMEYSQGDGAVKAALVWDTPDPALEMKPAIEAAKKADAIIYVGGISAELEGEEMKVDYEGFSGGDRTAIELPTLQQKLLDELHATGKPMVCVLMSGSALAVPQLDATANALLEAWYPGQAGGTAIANVLFGKTNPAGRLPVTFYRATSDLPPFSEYRMENRTYRYFKGKPLYPFGYGLSFTRFDYQPPRVDSIGDHTLGISIDIRNAGSRDGDEVVQVYLTPPHAREREALGAFKRVHLAKGEVQNVKLVVPTSALRRWNTEKHEYVIPTGDWQVKIGASSEDIRQTTTVKL